MKVKIKNIEVFKIDTSNGGLVITDNRDAGFSIFLNGAMIYKNAFMKNKLNKNELNQYDRF